MSLLNLLTSEDDVIAGQHVPSGENLWSSPTVNNSDDDIDFENEEILKEAIGLTSLPASLNGGEVLDFNGVPEEPGLSRELGDGEAVDFFGAISNPDIEDKSPKNDILEKLIAQFRKNNLNSEELRLKSVIKNANNIRNFSLKDGEVMRKELDKLEKKLLANQKLEQVSKLQEFKKIADAATTALGVGMGAGMGSGAGVAAGLLSTLLPGVNVIPTPIRMLIGGVGGAGIGAGIGGLIVNYFSSNPKEQNSVLQQSKIIVELEKRLKEYGVLDNELRALSDGTLTPETLPDAMLKRGLRVTTMWSSELTKLASQYVQAVKRLEDSFRKAKAQVISENPELAQEDRLGESPIDSPKDYVSAPKLRPISENTRERLPIASPAKAGSISDPTLGKGYSYDPHPSSGGYIVVTAPPGGEKSIGAILRPGTPAFEKIKAFDPAFKNPVPAPVAPAPAVEAPKVEEIKSPEITDNKLPKELTPSQETIQGALKRFLEGATIKTQTPDGTATTLDSDKLRKLTSRYIKDISRNKDIVEGMGLVSAGILDNYATEIETRMLEQIEKGMKGEQLRHYYNGLIWNALRKVWAKYKNANLKDHPTAGSESRRLRKLDRQDKRDVRRVERETRRASARIKSRMLALEEFRKYSK